MMIKKTNVDYKTYMSEYDSIREVLKDNDEQELNKTAFREFDLSSERLGAGFSLTNSYNEAKELMLNGWTSGSEKLTKSLKIANAKRKDKTVQRAIYDVVGFQASVPRYLQGIPTNMVNKKNVKQKKKVVTLNKAISYSSNVKADKILDDSVKFLQIVQAIEKKGIRVNINTVFHTKKGDEEIIIKVKIKSSNERLNISKMSFPLLHPSFLRRIMFKNMENDNRLKRNDWFIGYGKPQHINQTKKYLGNNEYNIPVLITDKQAENIVNNV